MNYYEHHLGDYAKDAAHLSLVEDGAYRRLLDAYYTREQPLPGDVKLCCKLARAATKVERDAVGYVLGEFFELRGDGYHQSRADHEIERFKVREADAEARRENEAERQRRHRERRHELFDALREHGIVPKFDTTTAELERLLSRQQSRTCNKPVTRDNPVPVTPHATANQTPVTSNQKPEDQEQKQDQEQKRPPAKKSPAAREPIPDPPEGVDLEAWTGFVAMRQRERHPLTARAAKLIFAELDKLRRLGHDPTAVLDQSTRNAWRDVYPIKDQPHENYSPGRKLSVVERVEANILARRQRDEAAGLSPDRPFELSRTG